MLGGGGSTTTLKAVLVGEDRSMSKAFDHAGDSATGLNKVAGGLGKTFAALPVAGVAAAAGVAVVKFAGDSIAAASDLNETINKSRGIFGDQAAAIEEWGSTAYKTMGLSKKAAIDAAAGFGDMFLQLGFAKDGAAKMSKDVVQLSADLGSFNNLPTADVTERISAAFRGEYDSLQLLIPNINAARVEQEAQRLGLVKNTVDVRKLAAARERQSLAEKAYTKAVREHGKESDEARRAALTLGGAQDAVAKAAKGAKGDITEQAKAQAVLSIVQKDGKRAAGDFAKTSDSLANQQKIMTAAFEDTKAEIGKELLPILTDLGKWFIREGIPAIKDATKWWSEHGDEIRTVASVIGKAIGWMVTGSVGSLKLFGDSIKRFGAIATWLWNNIFQPVTSKIVGAIGWLARTWASMLRGLSKVPGFGWAADAARKMDAAGDQADSFRARLVKIPTKKNVTISAATGRAIAAVGALQVKIRQTNGKTITVRVRYTTEGRLPNGGVSLLGGLTRAEGGPVFGPGTSTSDSILTWLSNDEHVLSAREVDGMGGHKAVESWRALARSGALRNAARLAGGGSPSGRSTMPSLGLVGVGGSGDIVIHTHTHLEVEGRQLAEVLQVYRKRSGQPLRLEETTR